MGVNSLPKTVTRQRRGCDLNPGPTAPESSTLFTRLVGYCKRVYVCACVIDLLDLLAIVGLVYIQVADGMRYIESEQYVHCDLAARNILVAADQRSVKISHFGLARIIEEEFCTMNVGAYDQRCTKARFSKPLKKITHSHGSARVL